MVSRCQDVLAQVADGAAASQGYAAGVWRDVTGDDFEKSSLAGTIPADNRNTVAHVDGEIDPTEKVTVVIGLGDVCDIEHVFLLPLLIIAGKSGLVEIRDCRGRNTTISHNDVGCQ